jgi:hypothetical protein
MRLAGAMLSSASPESMRVFKLGMLSGSTPKAWHPTAANQYFGSVLSLPYHPRIRFLPFRADGNRAFPEGGEERGGDEVSGGAGVALVT